MWAEGQRDLVLPRVLGHEVCGVDTVSGRRVVLWPGIACGTCPACRGRRENLCATMQILGFSRDGGLAEYVAVPARSLIPVPDGLPSVTTTLAEPLACALNALATLRLRRGERLLILGGGPLGLLLAFAARHAAGAVPAVVETSASRRKLGRQFLAGQGVELLAAAPAGVTFAAAVNATAAADAVACGLRRLQPGGAFCFFSGLRQNAEPPPAAVLNEIHYRELRITGAYGCTRAQMRRAVALLAEHADAAAMLVSGTLPLAQAERGLRSILEGNGLKWVVKL
jgi:threonine dehydrogenase-like Zn-dependent dehydrogenase